MGWPKYMGWSHPWWTKFGQKKLSWGRPKGVGPTSAQKSVGLVSTQIYFSFLFFFWTGPDPAQPFWSGMTLEIWKGGRRGRSGLVVASGDEEEECQWFAVVSGMTLEIWKGGRRGRSGLVVAHDVASGDEEEEWQWFAVVKKKMMATVVFPLCIEAHICSFLSFLFVFAFVLPFLYFSCPPPLCFSSFSFPSFVYLPFVLLCFFSPFFFSLFSFSFLFVFLPLPNSGCPLFFILSFFFLVPSNLLYFFSSPLIAW